MREIGKLWHTARSWKIAIRSGSGPGNQATLPAVVPSGILLRSSAWTASWKS